MRFGLFFLLAMASLLDAQSAAAASSGQSSEVAAYFRLLWGLLAVVGILLVLYAVVKKRFSFLSPRNHSVIKILEIRPLQPRKALCLIEVRGKEFLLGLSADHITLLADLNHPSAGTFSEILATSQHQENQSCAGPSQSA